MSSVSKDLQRLLFGGCLAVGCLAAWTPAKATFIQQSSLPDGLTMSEKYYLVAEKGSTNFSGDVGGQSTGVIVNAVANAAVDVATGWSTIKPVDALLTSITFTPVDPTRFGDFSLRGQLLATTDLTITVTDNQGNAPQTFTYPINNANQDITRIGIASTDAETIRTVTVTDIGGFEEVKQIGFSPCVSTDGGTCGTVTIPGGESVPEPASLAILGFGLTVAGFVGRRFRR